MKNLFFAFAFVLFAIMAATKESKAQGGPYNLLEEIAFPEKIVAIDKNSTGINDVKRDAVNPKALHHFEKSFKMIKDAKWMQLKDGFMVRFSQNDIAERVYYQANGSWAGTLKGYTVDKMPVEIRRIVKTTYPGCPIIYVDEANVAGMFGTPVYFVHLQNNEALKVVRICDGEMDVVFDSEKNGKEGKF